MLYYVVSSQPPHDPCQLPTILLTPLHALSHCRQNFPSNSSRTHCLPPCWEYPVLCATDPNLHFDPIIWLRSSEDPTVNFKTIHGHRSHKVRTTSTAHLRIIPSSTFSLYLGYFDGKRLIGLRLPPISVPKSYMERSILPGKSISSSILSSSEEASQASGECELRRIINPAFQLMSQGSRESFDIHRHKE